MVVPARCQPASKQDPDQNMEPTPDFADTESPFESGRVYNRQEDLHGQYGGQRQGGISTPAEHDLIFLFTSESGSEYGYRDEFRPDGIF